MSELVGLLKSESVLVRHESAETVAAHVHAALAPGAESLDELLAALCEIAAARVELPSTRCAALRALVAAAEKEEVVARIRPTAELLAALRRDVDAFLTGARACANPACGQPGAQLRCAQCHSAAFCSKMCLAAEWKAPLSAHKRHCRDVKTCLANRTLDLKKNVAASDADIGYLAGALINNLTRQADFCGLFADSIPWLVRSAIAAAGKGLKFGPATMCLTDSIMNAAQSAVVRQVLVNPAKSPDEKPLLRQIEDVLLQSPSVFVRRAAVSICRNVCFDNSIHPVLFTPEIQLPNFILALFRGEADFNKDDLRGMGEMLLPKRPIESDLEIKKLALDTLMLLVCNRPSRHRLILERIYPILREYDLVETDDDCKEKVVSMVELLMKDSHSEGDCAVGLPLGMTREPSGEPQPESAQSVSEDSDYDGPIIEEL